MFDLITFRKIKQLTVNIYKRYGVHARRFRFVWGRGVLGVYELNLLKGVTAGDQSPISTSSLEALAHVFTHFSSNTASRPPVAPTVTTHSRADRGNMLDDVFKQLGK